MLDLRPILGKLVGKSAGAEVVRGQKDSRKTTSLGARATRWMPGPSPERKTKGGNWERRSGRDAY